MGKPRYPAHVVRLLPRYPAKWCEECGEPILPKLEKPNASYPRVHLEQLTKFKKKRYCSRGCARRARARVERQAKRPTGEPAIELPALRRDLDGATERLLRAALNFHDGPDVPLAELFPPASDRGEA